MTSFILNEFFKDTQIINRNLKLRANIIKILASQYDINEDGEQAIINKTISKEASDNAEER